MSWQSISIQLLRTLINDLSDDSTYNDDILEMTLRTAASYVNLELGFSYTVNLTCGDITPDPVSDNVFINFVVLKAACIINGWHFQEKSLVQGIRARCGPAELQVNTGSSILLALLTEGPCRLYEQLREQYLFGNVDSIKAILSPFVSNNFLPTNSSKIVR